MPRILLLLVFHVPFFSLHGMLCRNLAMTALGSPPEEIVVTCRGGSPVAIQTDSHSTGKASWSYTTWVAGRTGSLVTIQTDSHSTDKASWSYTTWVAGRTGSQVAIQTYSHSTGKASWSSRHTLLGAGRTGSQVVIQTDSHSTGKASWSYSTWGRGGQGPR